MSEANGRFDPGFLWSGVDSGERSDSMHRMACALPIRIPDSVFCEVEFDNEIRRSVRGANRSQGTKTGVAHVFWAVDEELEAVGERGPHQPVVVGEVSKCDDEVDHGTGDVES